jgi:hypothetical protein
MAGVCVAGGRGRAYCCRVVVYAFDELRGGLVLLDTGKHLVDYGRALRVVAWWKEERVVCGVVLIREFLLVVTVVKVL